MWCRQTIALSQLTDFTLIYVFYCRTWVKARPGDDFDVAVSHLTDLQLVLGTHTYHQRAKELLLRKVIVTGVLFGAQTGHHHTPVLLDVMNIQLLEDKY